MHKTHGSGLGGFLRSRTGLALIVFLGVAGYFLWTEHQAHVIAGLPFVLVGGCLLMHRFMHHGGHGDGKSAGPGNGGQSGGSR